MPARGWRPHAALSAAADPPTSTVATRGGCAVDGGQGLPIEAEGDRSHEGGSPDDAAPLRVNDGMEHGSLAAVPVPAPGEMDSISSKIATFYASMPEAGRAVPCADPTIALAPSVFDTPALQLLLRFVVTCGGAGLSQGDQEALAALLLNFVPDETTAPTVKL